MITRLFLIFRLAFLLAIGLASPVAAQNPILVGAVVSQSGPHAELASGYQKGLLLWLDELNASGGLLGRKVELRLLDDGSEAVRAGALYVQLIREDKADLLVGPYGTAAAVMGGAEAESARRVLINGAGPSRAVHKRSPRYVFQTAVPYSGYGAGVLEIAREEGCKTLLILSRDDPAAREMADATKDAAIKLGFVTGDVEVHRGGASDFAPQVLKAKAAGADAWIAFGEARDAAEMVKSLKKQGYAPRLFYASGASDPELMRLVGQDAEFALGARAYDPRYATPANEAFVKAFSAKYSARPGAASVEGYVAGMVLAEGVRRAGTLDQEKLRATLATLAMPTVLGEHKIDPLTGEQVAAKAAVTQVVKGRNELVWPRAAGSAKRVLPYLPWSERKVLGKR